VISRSSRRREVCMIRNARISASASRPSRFSRPGRSVLVGVVAIRASS